MLAAAIKAFGDAEGIQLIDVPEPVPGPGQVLIGVEAIGVAGVDAMLRRGAIAGITLPVGHVPGGEVAGMVIEVGDGVDRCWLGRPVWGFTGLGGGYAEKAIADVSTLVEVPAGLSYVDAVTLGSAGSVAHFGLQRARLAPGERVLVRGAAGSIGIAAVQLAARDGAAVIAVTTSSAERGSRLRSLGATHVLNRTMIPLGDAGAAAPAAYDVILDVASGPDLAGRIGLLAPNGRLVQVGAVAGDPDDSFAGAIMGFFQRSVTVSTLSLATIDPREVAGVRADQFDAARRGVLRAVTHDVLPLAAAATAHRRMDAGEVFGRIVLVP